MPDSLPPDHLNPWIAGLMSGLSTSTPDPAAGPWMGRKPTPAELEMSAILDDLAREEDDAAAARGEPGAGADIMGRAVPRVMVLPSNAPPDPLAAMRDDTTVIRTGRRFLGGDFAQPLPLNSDAPGLPLPKGMKPPALVSGRAWRRATLPPEGWTCLGLRRADGVEGCGWCGCGMLRGLRFAVLGHHANDMMLSACLDCGDKLCGRSVADRSEDETPIPFTFPPLAAMLRDPSLWEGDPDTGRMILDLCEGFQVRMIETRAGIKLEIDFPDLAGEATVIGTYTNHGGALTAAFMEIEHWQGR